MGCALSPYLKEAKRLGLLGQGEGSNPFPRLSAFQVLSFIHGKARLSGSGNRGKAPAAALPFSCIAFTDYPREV